MKESKLNTDINVKAQFGKQLRIYREALGLSQGQLADYFNVTQPHIGSVERGENSIGIENMAEIAKYFGVSYYEMGNPKFPIPPLKKMPQALQDYIAQVKEERKARKAQPRAKLAPYLDKLLATKFLTRPRTAAQIAAAIEEAEKVSVDSGKVTALLTKHPRNKRVMIVAKPEGGTGTGHRYRLADVE